MHEKTTPQTQIGGTSAASTVRKSTTHVGDTVGRASDTTGSSTAGTTRVPLRATEHAPVTGGPHEQLEQMDRLRETRGKNPLVMAALALVVLAVGVALYFTVLA